MVCSKEAMVLWCSRSSSGTPSSSCSRFASLGATAYFCLCRLRMPVRHALLEASTAMSSSLQQISSHLTLSVMAMLRKTLPAKIGSRYISATSFLRGSTRSAAPSLGSAR